MWTILWEVDLPSTSLSPPLPHSDGWRTELALISDFSRWSVVATVARFYNTKLPLGALPVSICSVLAFVGRQWTR